MKGDPVRAYVSMSGCLWCASCFSFYFGPLLEAAAASRRFALPLSWTMAGIPPPRMRVSRSGLYDSQADNYPSDFLHDSAQLQETSAPFMNQPSLEDSLWPSHAPQDTPSGDDSEEYAQYSSNSATPGPATRTAGAASFPQMRGGNTNNNSNASPAAALKDLVKRLGNSSTPSRPPPPPAPRSEADSDILDSDTEKKQMHSIRTTFRQAAGQLGGPHDESDAIDLATPKQAHPGSRIPVSSGRPKQRRSSLERSTATGATGFRTSFSDDEAREEAEVSRIASSGEKLSSLPLKINTQSTSTALDRSYSRSFGDEEALDEAEVSRIASSGKEAVRIVKNLLLMFCLKRLTGLVQNLSRRSRPDLIAAISTTIFHLLKVDSLRPALHG